MRIVFSLFLLFAPVVYSNVNAQQLCPRPGEVDVYAFPLDNSCGEKDVEIYDEYTRERSNNFDSALTK